MRAVSACLLAAALAAPAAAATLPHGVPIGTWLLDLDRLSDKDRRIRAVTLIGAAPRIEPVFDENRKAPLPLPVLPPAALLPPPDLCVAETGAPGVCWLHVTTPARPVARPGAPRPVAFCAACCGHDDPRAPAPKLPAGITPPAIPAPIAPVPIPAAGLLLLSGLAALAWRKLR